MNRARDCRAEAPLFPTLLLAGAIASSWPLAATAQSGDAAETAPPQASTADEAWFTGPMLANSASTLPRGHFLIEPYLYDVAVSGHHSVGSLIYILYGVSDDLTLGAKPSFTLVEGGRGREKYVAMGDLSLQAQYQLRSARLRNWSPALSISLEQSLPTARYDRLGERPAAGIGSGSFGTTVALYAQAAGHLANGHIMRARLNLSGTVRTAPRVRGVSVYGTDSGFRGRAEGGHAAHIGIAVEYSVTRRWALAFDTIADWRSATIVAGTAPDSNGSLVATAYRLRSGWRHGVAPGIEYSWTPAIGVLVATRFVAAGPTGPASITPAVALNMVF
ncbi:MAG: hypothetical protein WC729_28690 [Sphingomonas sp.]|uniref:hypothetical protein n=1 Tax=Sphingomonas sp. TaxID=28214 RepID=UPI003563B877